MELATGTQVGPYEIQRKLGAGGMGVVYRALDSRLGRQVAIKVLPESMRHDTDRMRRFEREARTIGALNHPNLVTLHDVGTHDGTPFLVTELLDGMSLRQRLDEGRLEPREAVRIAGEIARGLAAAHGAGVTHRDIKPENIFVIGDDRVKVLDFGIAKLAQKDDDGTAKTMEGVGIGGAGPAHTGTGMVVGTPGYMAPEQLGGADVDARTDIFALGVVLYEMLAGRRPFASESGIEESYAILKQTPRDLPTNVPVAVARVVRRCLEKKPAARFQSASDLAFALEATEGASNESDPAIRARDAVAETMTQAAITGEGTAETLAPSSSSGTGPGSAVPTMPGVVSPIASIRARLGATPVPAARPATGVKERAITLVPPPRTRWPWALATAVALAAGGVAIAVVRRPPAVKVSAWPELVDGGAAFRRVTFLSQPATYARFTKDEQSILWSERRGDNWYVVQSGVSAPSMTTTTLTGRVLDVARTGTGDVAIRTFGDGEGGTLKRGNPGMGAPEFVAVHVEDASFSADGKSFAIIRALDDATYALEYPIDKPIYRPTTGRLEAVRMSRGGAYLAVVETDAPPQTSGRLLILKPDGTVVARSTTYDGIDGVAWSPSDGEVWFAEGSRLRALDLAGGDRVLHRSALPLRLRDVARDGRILVAPTTLRARTLLGSPAQNKWKNVGWFDGS
ncbi:MAG: serine/threonine-protein kinase, partial [Proteobacteria bacterium]|nr:serine/threonine-protein kinase [Pseudomonadota bacterium]